MFASYVFCLVTCLPHWVRLMPYIDPHIHMVSRTTDDYQRMALAGCVAVS